VAQKFAEYIGPLDQHNWVPNRGGDGTKYWEGEDHSPRQRRDGTICQNRSLSWGQSVDTANRGTSNNSDQPARLRPGVQLQVDPNSKATDCRCKYSRRGDSVPSHTSSEPQLMVG
jgi:hypothetical protein